MSAGQVLIVEDDPKMQRLLASQLAARGYGVHVAGDGLEAFQVLARSRVHLVILDITLPGMDGLEVCRRIRASSSLPIILVTAADKPEIKVDALDLGADDYLTKPFHVGELIARIRAVMRRAGAAEEAPPARVTVGELVVDFEQREVRRGNEILHLTRIEFELLRELVIGSERVLSYEHLLRAVWGEGYEDIRPVHVHICNLRRKIERGPMGVRYILALPGIGYRFRLSE